MSPLIFDASKILPLATMQPLTPAFQASLCAHVDDLKSSPSFPNTIYDKDLSRHQSRNPSLGTRWARRDGSWQDIVTYHAQIFASGAMQAMPSSTWRNRVVTAHNIIIHGCRESDIPDRLRAACKNVLRSRQGTVEAKAADYFLRAAEYYAFFLLYPLGAAPLSTMPSEPQTEVVDPSDVPVGLSFGGQLPPRLIFGKLMTLIRLLQPTLRPICHRYQTMMPRVRFR